MTRWQNPAYHRPRTLAEAFDLMSTDARYVAGGTDLLVSGSSPSIS